MGAKTVRPPVVQWPLTSHAKAITTFGTGSAPYIIHAFTPSKKRLHGENILTDYFR